MLDTFKIYNELKDTFGDEPARKLTLIVHQVYEELSDTVKREDFLELKAVVHELAEAQKRTEKRLDSLTIKVEELAQAQKKTEERLDSLTIKVEELAQAQKRTEERVEELAQAQKKTEERLDSLAIKVEELADAQRRTETELAKLIKEHRKTREQLGGLSHSVGYRLEDEAIWALPSLLNSEFGLKVIGDLKRGHLEVAPNRYIEVNIWGEAEKNGSMFNVLGEAKTQLKKKDVDKFQKLIKKVGNITGRDIFPVLITYQTSPQVLSFAKEKGIKVYFSYELRK
ncbi:MAG: chordopoxvirus fusion protein [Deltaproteobacteria bacterium]|nr:MAG: chordopoxvirus fusion protein [Deltaproteobacteria bacterium]